MATDQSFGKVTDQDKQMAQMCHFAALAGVVACGMAMPLGPLLIWQAKKSMSPFVDAHGKEALNFQLTWWVPTFFLGVLGAALTEYLLILPILLIIFAGVMAIMGGLKAAEGQMFYYPASIRLIR
jgi:uncharacterized Tic20 family protein